MLILRPHPLVPNNIADLARPHLLSKHVIPLRLLLLVLLLLAELHLILLLQLGSLLRLLSLAFLVHFVKCLRAKDGAGFAFAFFCDEAFG